MTFVNSAGRSAAIQEDQRTAEPDLHFGDPCSMAWNDNDDLPDMDRCNRNANETLTLSGDLEMDTNGQKHCHDREW